MKYYAHSLENEPVENWQPLEKHLENVAKLAADFAKPFGGEDWAYLAGLWHDVGKGTLAWQSYLRKVNEVIDEFSEFYDGHPSHASLGAKKVYEYNKEVGKLLAYCISGHHGGLPNWNDPENSSLESRLDKEYSESEMEMVFQNFPENFAFTIIDKMRVGFQIQFYMRMLFSCLVDADYLDTEKFMDKNRSEYRETDLLLEMLYEKFFDELNLLRKDSTDTKVNKQREIVLQNCLEISEAPPGLFSLTVPTGGGKTLSSMAFALKHAKKYGKRRIIYVIPFTSIIEQNAKVFKDILGPDAVLEHHCNFITDDSDWKTRLNAENWDSPIIVTTNVQFFNSFYANKTSKCRKLHNIVNSIIIFDEIQAIPVEKINPCLEVIKELSLNYGVTSVLCTATQPAFKYADNFKSGLENVREIISDVPSLFAMLKRTKEQFIGTFSEEEIAEKILEHEQVLCIVNTRQQALDVFYALPESCTKIHLSAIMYPAHRTEKLNEIRKLLDDKLPCYVISTQLIEAGVDIDFPCVFRAITGIDSIAQAAGRCNRNGLSATPCDVFVFAFSEDSSCSFFRQAAQSATKLFEEFSGDLTAPECVKKYFADYFWKNEQRMDHDGIVQQCSLAQSLNIQFKDIAKFKMIKSATIPVIIALEKESIELVKSLDFCEHKGGILRKLQRYTVQIYPYQFDEISDWFESPMPGVWVLRTDELYSDETGLNCKPPEGNAFFG